MRPSLPRPALWTTALFAFLGFIDAAYLTVDHYLAVPLPCSLTAGCDTVLNSAYATVGPIPLAAIGAAYYLLALLLAVYIYTSESPYTGAARAIWILSGMGVLASFFYIYIQIFIIQALCVYCLGSALTSILLFVASSFLVFRKI